MSIDVRTMELPEMDLRVLTERGEMIADVERVRGQHWLARTPLGYTITRHEDVGAFLRDRRFSRRRAC